MIHSPKSFINFMAMLKRGGEANERKIKAIKEMGFGEILSFDIQNFNFEWAADLVNSYNLHTSNIVLPNGDRVHISEDDVYCVFGFPKGDRDINLYGNAEDTKYNELMTKLSRYWDVSVECTSFIAILRILTDNDVNDDGL